MTLVETAPALSRAFRSADRRAKAKRLARRIVGLAASERQTAHLAGFRRREACPSECRVPGRTHPRRHHLCGGPTRPSRNGIEHGDPSDRSSRDRRRRAPAHRRARLLGLPQLRFSRFAGWLGLSDRAECPPGRQRPSGVGLRARHLRRVARAVSWFSRREAGQRPPWPRLSLIALFPKEMQRDPASACLSPGAAHLHDVPWDEPRVLAAYRDRLVRRHPRPGGPDRSKAVARVRSRRAPERTGEARSTSTSTQGCGARSSNDRRISQR